MFRNRAEAGLTLAQRLQGRPLHDPIVLAIPRGGVVTGDALAKQLGIELDAVLACKIRSPLRPEKAIGAVSEGGAVHLIPNIESVPGVTTEYLEKEKAHQLQELKWKQESYRTVRPPAHIEGRSVIVVDDLVATGSSMIAALHAIQARHPYEVIVAVAVAPPERLPEIRSLCNEVVCLFHASSLLEVGQFYEDFRCVEDADVMQILQPGAAPPAARKPAAKPARRTSRWARILHPMSR